jgi:hypothetical protein
MRRGTSRRANADLLARPIPVALTRPASGLPQGTDELGQNPEQLANILVVDKAGAGGPVPNYSLVQVVGCLAQSADAWILTNSTEPARARETGDSKLGELQGSESRPLGDRVFRLLDLPSSARETLKGHKVQAKGFLIRQPDDERLSLTSLQAVSENCVRWAQTPAMIRTSPSR